MISIICALGKNRAIGRANALPWHISADLKRFKAITTGHPVIMGRKTHESIGRPLPQRTNIVVSRRPDYVAEGCRTATSLEAALELAVAAEGGRAEIFIIGGGQVYARALPLADRLYLTLVDDEPGDADTFFPKYDGFSRTVSEEAGAENGLPFRFVVLERPERGGRRDRRRTSSS